MYLKDSISLLCKISGKIGGSDRAVRRAWVFGHDIIMCSSSCIPPQGHKRISAGNLLHLPVSLLRLCDVNLKRVKDMRYVSGIKSLLQYTGWVTNSGFNLLYKTLLVLSDADTRLFNSVIPLSTWSGNSRTASTFWARGVLKVQAQNRTLLE